MEKKTRLVSLDIFRGLAIGGMILANNPGDYEFVYPSLDHAEWNGWTPVDLVFPFFLFIVGVSIVFALDRDQGPQGSGQALAWRILKRSLVLFALGLLCNAFPSFDWRSLRIPGVLQRIAVVYLLASFMYLRLSWRALLGTIVGILLGYWGLLALMPVPGVGHPSMDRDANLVAWLDRLILRRHLWEYDTPWDPEGILSTFPALCIGLIGVLAGQYLKGGERRKSWPMLAWGAALAGLGLVWNTWYPINKGLCTSSFVVFVSGVALATLAACHWAADIRGYVRWLKPLLVMGMNSLFIYLSSDLLVKIMFVVQVPRGAGEPINLHAFLYETYFTSWLEPFHASLAWALFFCLLQLGMAWLLYARKVFIKI